MSTFDLILTIMGIVLILASFVALWYIRSDSPKDVGNEKVEEVWKTVKNLQDEEQAARQELLNCDWLTLCEEIEKTKVEMTVPMGGSRMMSLHSRLKRLQHEQQRRIDEC